MTITRITFIALCLALIAACTGSKKTTTSSVAKTEEAKPASTPTVAAATPPPAPPVALPGPTLPPNALIGSAPGVIPPTENELNALTAKYPNLKDATLDKLKKGHYIYTQGACIGCHRPINIYNIPLDKISFVLSDMSLRARLNDADKDAVVNYVIAIKTAQPK